MATVCSEHYANHGQNDLRFSYDNIRIFVPSIHTDLFSVCVCTLQLVQLKYDKHQKMTVIMIKWRQDYDSDNNGYHFKKTIITGKK